MAVKSDNLFHWVQSRNWNTFFSNVTLNAHPVHLATYKLVNRQSNDIHHLKSQSVDEESRVQLLIRLLAPKTAAETRSSATTARRALTVKILHSCRNKLYQSTAYWSNGITALQLTDVYQSMCFQPRHINRCRCGLHTQSSVSFLDGQVVNLTDLPS